MTTTDLQYEKRGGGPRGSHLKVSTLLEVFPIQCCWSAQPSAIKKCIDINVILTATFLLLFCVSGGQLSVESCHC